MKTSELIGPALDWAVATCEERGDAYLEKWNMGGDKRFSFCGIVWAISTVAKGDAMGIIEREKISTWWDEWSNGWKAAGTKRMNLPVESAEFEALPAPYDGPTLLVAAMRCYVASKLGDEINVPEELLP